jgi:hypothetical protein
MQGLGDQREEEHSPSDTPLTKLGQVRWVNSDLVLGTHVPVEEPSTASIPEVTAPSRLTLGFCSCVGDLFER